MPVILRKLLQNDVDQEGNFLKIKRHNDDLSRFVEKF